MSRAGLCCNLVDCRGLECELSWLCCNLVDCRGLECEPRWLWSSSVVIW